ncbi:MAG: hypothetical protein U0175_33335 [Caldilineaceae bacterium]
MHPATLAQIAVYEALGLRARILTLPVMMALVLSLLWQQTGSICEMVRLVHEECVFVGRPLTGLTQQALSTRLRMLPAELFLQVLLELLPGLAKRSLNAAAPYPLNLPGRKGNTLRFAPAMAQLWMHSCARSGCCRRMKRIHWRDAC